MSKISIPTYCSIGNCQQCNTSMLSLQEWTILKFKNLGRQQKNYPHTSHAITSDVVVILCLRLGNGSAVVFQQHTDVMSQLISSLGVTLTFCHEWSSRVTNAVLRKSNPCLRCQKIVTPFCFVIIPENCPKTAENAYQQLGFYSEGLLREWQMPLKGIKQGGWRKVIG